MTNSKSGIVILASALTGTLVNAQAISKGVSRPNILVVVCEDISPYLGCYGDSVAVTPNLDSFAKEGILHTNMYTCVGVSAPSRYSLITGRYSTEDGANFMRVNYFNKEINVIPPSGVKCYTEFLRQAGYYCTNNAKTDYQFDTPLTAWDEQGNKAHWKNAPDNVPFFSIINLNVTHESQIWKNTDKPLVVSPEKINVPPYYPDNNIVRHDMAVMYSNIAKMDKQFRSLLDELERSDRADNTIVIFYSDNGGPLPRAKREIKDSGTKVPFLIRFPDKYKGGTKNTDLNMFVDIPATIMSLADIAPPAYMHGQAMYGMYKSTVKRKFVFGATDRFDEQVEKRASIRSEKYLYIRNYMPQEANSKPNAFRLQMPMMQNMIQLWREGELDEVQSLWFKSPAPQEELYDCDKDPYQIHNLAEKKEYHDLLLKMRTFFQEEWIDKYNPFWVNAVEEDFLKRAYKGGVTPKVENPKLKLINGIVSVENLTNAISIAYQINGKGISEKHSHWFIYSNGFKLNPGDKASVVATRIGYKNSDIIEIQY